MRNFLLSNLFPHLWPYFAIRPNRSSLTHGSARAVPPTMGGVCDSTFPAFRRPSGKTQHSIKQPFVPFENSLRDVRINKMLRAGVP